MMRRDELLARLHASLQLLDSGRPAQARAAIAGLVATLGVMPPDPSPIGPGPGERGRRPSPRGGLPPRAA